MKKLVKYLTVFSLACITLSSLCYATVTYNVGTEERLNSVIPQNSSGVAVRAVGVTGDTSDSLTSLQITNESTDNGGKFGIGILKVYLYEDDGDGSYDDGDTELDNSGTMGGGASNTQTLSFSAVTFEDTDTVVELFVVIDVDADATIGAICSLNITALNGEAIGSGVASTTIFTISGITKTVSNNIAPSVVIPGDTYKTILWFSSTAWVENAESFSLTLANDNNNFMTDGVADGVVNVYLCNDNGVTGSFETGTDNVIASVLSGNFDSVSEITLTPSDSSEKTLIDAVTRNFWVLYSIGSDTSISNSNNVQARFGGLTGTGSSSGLSMEVDSESLGARSTIGGITYASLTALNHDGEYFGPGSTIPIAKVRLRAEAMSATINSVSFLNSGTVPFITDPDNTNGITNIRLYLDDGDFQYDGPNSERLLIDFPLGNSNQENMVRISGLSITVNQYNQDEIETNEVGMFIVYAIGIDIDATSATQQVALQFLDAQAYSNEITSSHDMVGTLPSVPSIAVDIVQTNLDYSDVISYAYTYPVPRYAVNVPVIGIRLSSVADLTGLRITVGNPAGTFKNDGTGISRVAIYRDLDGTGAVSNGDTLLTATENFATYISSVLPTFTLPQGDNDLLVVYNIGAQCTTVTNNVRARIDAIDSSEGTVKLNGELPIPRDSVLLSVTRNLTSVKLVSVNISSVTNISGTFAVEVVVSNDASRIITIDAAVPKFFFTSISGLDKSAEYTSIVDYSYPVTIDANTTHTFNFVIDPAEIRHSGTILVDAYLRQEGGPTFDFDLEMQRYQYQDSDYYPLAQTTSQFSTSTTFDYQAGQLPTYILSITVDGRSFRSGNNIQANDAMTITFTNNGLDVNHDSMRVYLNDNLLEEGNDSNDDYTYDSTTGVLTINNLGTETGEISIYLQDNSGNDLETLTLSFVVSSELEVRNFLLYPNPFRPSPAGSSIKIGYQSSREGTATVYIYNVLGRLIQTLSNNTEVGYNEISWDGLLDSGKPIASGMYILRIIMIDTDGNRVVDKTKLGVY